MAESDIVQNMIFQLGQSQDDRASAELGIHFADLDERTSAELMLEAKKFAPFVNYYRNSITTPEGDWSSFFTYDEAALAKLLETPDAVAPPHLALFAAFLEIHKLPLEVLNTFTGRHLDFYYREVLRLQRRAPVPDRAHLVLDLKKNAPPISIKPGRDYFSGKDDAGLEVLYDPAIETVINAAKVTSLRSLFVDKSQRGIVRYAPIANSSDGLGGKLEGEEGKWFAFGRASLPQAPVGFALGAPVLRMREGARKVIVLLTVENVDYTKLNTGALGGAFEVFISGEKTWLGPYAITPVLNGPGFNFEFSIPAAEKAVIDYTPAIHGYNYATEAPVLQVLFKGNASVGYNDLKNIVLKKAQISVEVSGITSVHLENDHGSLDPKKAFLPFGPQPTRGSRFLVGYDEAFSKKLSEVGISVQWKDLPGDFSSLYPSGTYGPSVNSDYFTAGVAFQDGGTWNFSATGQKLFNIPSLSGPREFAFNPAGTSTGGSITTGMHVHALSRAGSHWAGTAARKFLLEKPIFRAFSAAVPEPKAGFVTFSLEKDFFHAAYRQKYAEQVLAFTKDWSKTTITLLGEPYTPAIQSIFFSYQAHSDDVNISSTAAEDFANADLQFFQMAYFGQARDHGFQRSQFAFLKDVNVPLFPEYNFEGELLAGFSPLQSGDSISVLFQVAEGSADPDLDPQKISWFVLCDNYWKPLGSEGVVRDTTNNLLTSGIIKFVIPAEATTTNTVLPAGQIWIKGAVPQQTGAVSQLVNVTANAVEARYFDQGNNPGHLNMALSKGKLTRLKNGSASVKSVAQPYASFGGSREETEAAFNTRASERLRHKSRCITPWDYERITLQAFPKVHKVKCIPHASEASWLSPGHVLLVVVPDLRNKNAIDPLQPKVDANTLSEITSHLSRRRGMQVQLKVKNPSYQKIKVDFAVKFHIGFEFNFYSNALRQELIQYLSPWAFDGGRDISFGGKIYKSVILDFVEELEYVDYVTDFKMFSYAGSGGGGSDLNEARPETPDAILVSENTHAIRESI
jgi:hypothetical protein